MVWALKPENKGLEELKEEDEDEERKERGMRKSPSTEIEDKKEAEGLVRSER